MVEKDPKREYKGILLRYLTDQTEEHLLAAQDLGRALVTQDVPIEEIATLHEDALESVAATVSDIPDNTKWASAVILEVLMAYGLAFRERNARLEKREKALSESEQRFRSLFEGSNQGFLVHRDFKPLQANAALARTFGYGSPDEILALPSTLELFATDDRARVKHYHQARIKEGSAPRDYEIKGLKKDGTEFWLNNRPFRIDWPDGPAICSVLFDITERKQAEEALGESEARIRAVFDNTPVCLNLKDTEGRYLLVNEPYAEWLGRPAEEIIGKRACELMENVSEVDNLTAAESAVLVTGETYEQEVSVPRPDGNVYDRIVIKYPVKSADGLITAIGTVAIDITERKRAEEGFQRLAAAIEQLSEVFSLYGPDDRLIVCNEQYRKLNAPIAEASKPGTTHQDHLRAIVYKGLAPEGVGREEEWIQERLAQYRNPGPPFEAARQDGRWFLTRVQRMPDGSTAIISTDITERKRAEQALRESEEHFRAVVDNSPTAILLKDTDGHYLIANKRWHEWFNPKGHDIAGKTVYDFYDKAHADVVTAQDREVLETGLRMEREHQMPLADGTVMTSIFYKFPIFDPDGRVAAIGGINSDITERKRAEEALQKSQAQLLEAQQIARLGN